MDSPFLLQNYLPGLVKAGYEKRTTLPSTLVNPEYTEKAQARWRKQLTSNVDKIVQAMKLKGNRAEEWAHEIEIFKALEIEFSPTSGTSVARTFDLKVLLQDYPDLWVGPKNFAVNVTCLCNPGFFDSFPMPAARMRLDSPEMSGVPEPRINAWKLPST